MSRRAPSVAIACIFLFAAPAAVAAWSYQGSTEPDTPADLEGYMHVEPDQAAGRDGLYFNVFPQPHSQVNGVGPSSPPRPNLNVAGSRVVTPSSGFTAMLGAWKDCDRDGFIGNGTLGLAVYRVELLPPNGPCAPGDDHNRDGWVWEFLPIYTGYPSARGIVDPGAAVWGDLGTPGSPPPSFCKMAPLPRETTRNTGAALQLVDCNLDHAVAATLGDVGLAFEDPQNPQDDCGHPLARETPFGGDPCHPGTAPLERDSDRPAFTAWDCSDPKWQDVRDPLAPPGERGPLSGQPQLLAFIRSITGPLPVSPATGPSTWTDEEGTYVSAAFPAPSLDHPTDGSYYDALGHALAGLKACRDQEIPHPEDDRFALWTTAGSRNASSTSVEVKRSTDFTFRFVPGGWAPTPAPAPLTGIPNRAGVAALANLDGGWVSQESTRTPGHHGTLVRRDGQPAGAQWFTFYARAPGAAAQLDLPPLAGHFYGRETCEPDDTVVSPARWDCDASHWWNPAWDAPAHTGYWTVARPGMSYHVRDVDCYDGRVATQGGEGVGLAGFSPDGACPPP
ncbi:MAG TPA: hypothetical protein VHH36_03475 [Candidatus Thermoplasmatota archaeon]|nr:hypothetical protein [Candidatus Thermoplasmatota archaeon]